MVKVARRIKNLVSAKFMVQSQKQGIYNHKYSQFQPFLFSFKTSQPFTSNTICIIMCVILATFYLAFTLPYYIFGLYCYKAIALKGQLVVIKNKKSCQLATLFVLHFEMHSFKDYYTSSSITSCLEAIKRSYSSLDPTIIRSYSLKPVPAGIK